MASSFTQRLAKLVQAEQRERTAARELAVTAQQTTTERDDARGRLVEAHATATPADVKKAERGFREAAERADDLAIRVEAAALRVRRAEQQRAVFESENGRELIRELGPAALAAVEGLTKGRAQLVEADRAWNSVAQRVTELLARIPGATPAQDAAGSHGLEQLVRDLRTSPDPATPIPHWAAVIEADDEQRRVKLVRLRRPKKPTDQERQEIARLSRELDSGSAA